ncbi:DUF885 domain-containing protein [Pendulispora brunnea]|uniref:DUF885 domain-containing protein n=1 Tax=Pendulispora brunnea TaxID=2905690 RepID=A0ABZ2KD20_9BACT
MTVLQLADTMLDLLAEEDPLNELLQGYPGYEHRLPDPEEAAEARLRERAQAVIQSARALEPPAEDKVTHALVLQQAESLVDRIDARLIEHTMADYITAPIAKLFLALPLVRVTRPEQEEAYLERLEAVPQYLGKAAERHRQGVAAQRFPVAERVQAAVARLDAYLAEPEVDPLRRPTLTGARAEQRERLLAEKVRPAFAEYREVLAGEIAPHGRPEERPGLCWLPNGAATYAAVARTHTTTGHTPGELHRIGLELIERLADEYVAIGGSLFGVRTVAEVHERMRTDPAMRWKDGDELLACARAAIDRAEAAAPSWFGRLPSHRCALERTPAEAETSVAAAYYIPAPMDGSHPGTYYANTYRANERSRYGMEATSFHEAVPGHHFQITIAQELKELHMLRQVAGINAYIEGWGLYAERLADEMGLYSGAIDRLGMLAADSMRAARLVVDTGLHALGWSRARVVEYLQANTVMDDVEIQAETDRYIEMPGQALSYMVGRLELQRMRSKAQVELGAAFDFRAFHDLLLGGGALPMAVLDGVVSEWTQGLRTSKSG